MTNRLISPRLWTAFFSLEPRLSSLNTTSSVQSISNFFISLSLVPFKCKTIITVCFLHNNPCGFFQGKVKYQKLPSGNSDYIEFYDKKGEMVATYSTMTGRCILPMRRLPDRQKCIYVYLETVLLYMPDYKNKPENTETLMPWYDMILQRCQIKSKS